MAIDPKQFFQNDNKFDLATIRKEGYGAPLSEPLREMITRIVDNSLPFVVPHADDQKRVSFLVVAESQRSLGELRRVLTAYLGGERALISAPTDSPPAGTTLHTIRKTGFAHTLQISFRLSDDESESDERVRLVAAGVSLINAAVEAYSGRPATDVRFDRPVAEVLRDFNIAYTAPDGERMRDCLAELVAGQALGRRNLLILEIKTLKAQEKWSEIINHPKIGDLLSRPPTGPLLEIILDAIYGDTDFDLDPSKNSLAEVRSYIAPVQEAFRHRPKLRQAASETVRWKIWGICRSATGMPCPSDLWPVDVVDELWVTRLNEWSGHNATKVSGETNWDELLESDLNAQILTKLLSSISELNHNQRRTLHEKLKTKAPLIEELVEAEPVLRAPLDELRDEFGSTPDLQNWAGWINHVLDSPRETISAIELEEITEHWSETTWFENDTLASLDTLIDRNPTLFREILPKLISWLSERDISVSSEVPKRTLESLAAGDHHAISDLSLAATCLRLLLNSSHSASDYQESLKSIAMIWEKLAAPRTIVEGINLFELIIDYPCADENEKLMLWQIFRGSCVAHWRTIPREFRSLIAQLAEALEESRASLPPESELTADNDADQVDLSGQKLGIYTLTEGAGRRAKNVLAELFPGLNVELNHDKVATSALDNLAKTADYFVFTDKSAAHQAYYRVKDLRGDDLLYPSGKGSSSIITKFIAVVGQA